VPAIVRKRCQKCGTNRALHFYRSERSRVCLPCQRSRARRSNRDVRLGETYGITVAEYDAMFAAQDGRCAICGGRRTGNLDVDHDHAREKELRAEGLDPLEATRRSIRGLLCRRCNRRLLPASQDSAERLRAAIRYLRRPPAQDVLSDRAQTLGT
jgi:hypothetical protein